jgi:8-oxo-dGTP pyrophosphatase MutT (NUDIX family)
VLVKLRYAPGWRVPGGGRHPHESAEAAVLRELREEIGLTDHGRVRLADEVEESVHFKRDLAAVLIVEDVEYQPKWTWEVEEVAEFALDQLPPDTSSTMLRWIAALRQPVTPASPL